MRRLTTRLGVCVVQMMVGLRAGQGVPGLARRGEAPPVSGFDDGGCKRLTSPRAGAVAAWSMSALAALALAGAAKAETWPSKPIRLIVPYSAGGSTDQLARAVQPSLSRQLGTPVIVENRPGAGGAIGTELVARAAPDGYTLIFGNSAPSAVVSLLREVPYDVRKDFVPVSTVALVPLALVGSNKLKARNFQEFLDEARQPDAKLNYGSVGTGSMSHLTGEFLNELAGLSVLHIPYSGGGALGTAVMAGEVETAWVNPLDGTAMVASGRARYLAVASPERLDWMPDVPAVAEFLPGFTSTAWFGVLAPAGTAQDIIERLNETIVHAVAEPEVRQAIENKKAEPRSSTPAELAQRIDNELAQWGPLIRRNEIRL
ncbi:MAG: tripartite tricarboxylate transporter substrate binding protein [Pigmentiphaga sp.]|nr:tripartite tricarboxylate transporter substrate binding protein [Pigmentiphaga sp.]